MYKLGTHNSMSYLPPKQWWMKPFHFIAKCQNKTVQEQYASGVEVFDIRIKWNRQNHTWEFAHGSMIFKSNNNIEDIFSYLNEREDKLFIRLILEYNKPPKDVDNISIQFQYDVEKWIEKYTNLTFFAFNRKYDWKELYHSNYKPIIEQAVSSMNNTLFDDWCPWLYAKINNKKKLEQGTDKDILLIDFVK